MILYMLLYYILFIISYITYYILAYIFGDSSQFDDLTQFNRPHRHSATNRSGAVLWIEWSHQMNRRIQ